jgi:glycosyltransferase involved in cell wall biosynthesis
MRIGIDARELQGHPTGTGRYLRNLLKAWPSGDTLVLYFKGAPPPNAYAPRADARPVTVGGTRGRGLLWLERDLPAAAALDSLDVFFSPAYFCPRRVRLPRVTTVHDLSFFSLPSDFAPWEAARRRWLVGGSLRRSAGIVTVSDFTAREISAYFPDAAARVTVIPHAADADIPPGPERVEARRQLEVRGPYLLSVGSILNRRHLGELLRALRAVVRVHHECVLDVVGDNRTHPRADFAALISELGLERHVRLSGFVSDEALARRYAAADAAVYLSEYEGFGLPVLEAMARGIPVLTSRRPATGEIFGEAALVVEPDDTLGITGALARLLDGADLRTDLAARGRALAARFSWTEAARRTRAVLADAAGAR